MPASKSIMETVLPPEYIRPAVTVDVVVFTIQGDALKVLLVKRSLPPFEGKWALPGGFVRKNESLDEAAARELEEETGVKSVFLEQLYTYGDPRRDPRGRVFTVAYYALINPDQVLRAATDVSAAAWFPLSAVPRLAFDHTEILAYALQRLRYKLEYTSVAFQLLPPKFTLTQLQKVYETVLGKKFDKRNFRKKILSLDLLQPLPEKKRGGAHRPAQLFHFKKKGLVEAKFLA